VMLNVIHPCNVLCRSGPESLEHLTVCSEKFLASDGGQVQGYQGNEHLEGTAVMKIVMTMVFAAMCTLLVQAPALATHAIIPSRSRHVYLCHPTMTSVRCPRDYLLVICRLRHRGRAGAAALAAVHGGWQHTDRSGAAPRLAQRQPAQG
jgi:hypothetical protein